MTKEAAIRVRMVGGQRSFAVFCVTAHAVGICLFFAFNCMEGEMDLISRQRRGSFLGGEI